MLFRNRLWFSLILIFVSSVAFAQKSLSENDLKKKAEKYFNDEKYDDAVPLYSQLLSVYPQNSLYNYRYGVCLLYSGKDKSQGATYLETAAKAPKPTPEVHYYLGKTYMYGNHFYEAIAEFNQFKKAGSSSQVKSLNVDLLIKNCNNAIELNKDRRNISIINHRAESRNSFYSTYDFSKVSGKLLAASDNFLTPMDKEKKNSSVMFMDKENTTVFYASYGKKGENGKDLYKVIKRGGSEWSEAINLGNTINTAEDEDFPYLDKDGKTLYFCSKGHNSMGGYDIFKSVYDQGTGEWSVPVNIGVPVNTIEDDLLYVPTLAGDEATYATAIESQTGEIEIRHIRLGDVIPDVSVIKGIFVSQDQVMRKEARITVLRESSHDIVTSINTNPRTGEYELMLPPGENYILVVEGGGYLPHAENFSLPTAMASGPLKQKVVMDRKGDVEEMTLNNFFIPRSGSATAAIETPSEVKVSGISTRDVDTTKIKPITIDGKSVYVALPAVLQKSDNQNVVSNQDKAKSPATEQETPPLNNVDLTGAKETKADDEVALNTKKDVKDSEKQSSETIKDSTNDVEDAKTEDVTSKPDAITNQPVITEKASNAELVKISFEDANALKEEAVTIKEQLAQKQSAADSLRSLSKDQAKQSEQLMSTDSVSSIRLADESKVNATQAENKRSEAFAMNRIASNKEKEAERALSQATQLMTQLKVDTSAEAYQASSKSKTSKGGLNESAQNNNAEPGTKDSNEFASDNKTTPSSSVETKTNENKDASETQPVALDGTTGKGADDTSIHPEEKGEQNAAPLNPHLENANRLQAESEELSTKSYEKSQAALNTTDKKEKAELEKEAKDLKKQSVAKKDESTKEALLAEKEERKNADLAAKQQATTTQQVNTTGEVAPIAVNPRYEKAMELKQESVELAGQADERIQKAQTSTDKEEKSALLSEAKDFKRLSAVKKKESDKEFTLAQKEDKIQAKAATNKTLVADKNKTEEQNKIADGSDPVNQIQNEVSDSVSQSLAINTQGNNSSTEGNRPNESVTETKLTNTERVSEVKENAANVNSKEENVKAEKETVSEAPKVNTVVPEASRHYLAYTDKIQQSQTTKKQAEDIESKLATLGGGSERDSLVKVSNELNRQSIVQWQEGQKELAEAKAIDPEVEEKMGVANKGTKEEAREAREEVKKTDEIAQLNTAENSKPEEIKQTTINETPKQEAKEIISNNSNSTAQPPVARAQRAGSNPDPQVSGEQLDTTRAEYPQYVEVQRKITEKQDETVNVFIEGMQVNKKAIAEKEEEMKLRDRAEVEKNPKRKAAFIAQADSVKVLGDSLTELSREKLALAQEDTRAVKTLTAQSDELKSKLLVRQVVPKAIEGDALANNLPVQQSSNGDTDKSTGENKNATRTEEPVPGNQQNKPSETLSNQTTLAAKTVEEARQGNEALQVSSAPVSTPATISNRSSFEGTAIMPVDYTPTDVVTFTRSTMKDVSEILMDPALPEGLVFKVQIGAFKTPLPADAFGGLQPLNGETSRPGWIRYCLGLFRSFEPANLLKKEVRGMNYKDAFVVAYFNGKRISLTEAYAIVGKATAKEKQAYASVAEMEFKHLSKYKMIQSDFDGKADEDSKSFYGTTETVSKDLIEYTVQVGAYKTSKTPNALASLVPLNAEKTVTGLYRFTTGRFQNYTSADSMKKIAVATGVKDAFIVVYKGGTKMGQTAMTEFLRTTRANLTASVNTTGIPTPQETIVAVTNPTPEPVAKTTEAPANEIAAADVIFKIQLGAFKETVPTTMVNSFLQLADQGITQEDDSRGFHIYYAGQYKSYDEAVTGKNTAVGKGLKDAFIMAFAKGKRITIAEAQKALTK